MRGRRATATAPAFQTAQGTTMPLVQITLIEGREQTLVTECARRVARTVHETLGAPLDRIRVVVTEVPATHWLVGDQSRAETDAAAAAAQSNQGAAA